MFEEVKFGDKFKSKDGNMAIYLGISREDHDQPYRHILLRNNLGTCLPDSLSMVECIGCDDNGKIKLHAIWPHKNIISKWDD